MLNSVLRWKNKYKFLSERTITTTTSRSSIEVVISENENPKDVKTQLLQHHKENYAEKRTYLIFMRGTEEVIDNNDS